MFDDVFIHHNSVIVSVFCARFLLVKMFVMLCSWKLLCKWSYWCTYFCCNWLTGCLKTVRYVLYKIICSAFKIYQSNQSKCSCQMNVAEYEVCMEVKQHDMRSYNAPKSWGEQQNQVITLFKVIASSDCFCIVTFHTVMSHIAIMKISIRTTLSTVFE